MNKLRSLKNYRDGIAVIVHVARDKRDLFKLRSMCVFMCDFFSAMINSFPIY